MSSSEVFIDRSLVERMASEGRPMREIAEAVGVSRRRFLRIKARDNLLRYVYERGVRAHAAASGREFVRIGGSCGKTAVVAAGYEARKDPTTAVLKYIRTRPGASFGEICKALHIGEDDLCDALVELILERRLVYGVWCGTVEQRRYFPRAALTRAA